MGQSIPQKHTAQFQLSTATKKKPISGILTALPTLQKKTGETSWSPFNLSEHFNTLIKITYQTRPILVILDPLMAILGSRISASYDQQVREHLSYLALMADRADCAVLIVRHLNN